MDNEKLIMQMMRQAVLLNGLVEGLHKLGFESMSTHDELGDVIFDLLGYEEEENREDLRERFYDDYVVFLARRVDGRRLEDKKYVQRKALDLYHCLRAVKAAVNTPPARRLKKAS